MTDKKIKTTHIKFLAVGACMALLAACGASAPSSYAVPDQASGGADVRGGITTLTNLHRADRGLSSLQRSAALDLAAQAHADDMARNGFFAHKGSNGGSVMDRVKAAGFNACLVAENIAYGQRDAFSVVRGWVASPGHRQNIENKRATVMGIGYIPASAGQSAQYVQVFADPC